MNRKRFLGSLLAAGLQVPGLPAFLKNSDGDAPAPILPRYLRPGDTIGITCPAGTITPEEIQPAMVQLVEWEFNIKVGDTVGKKDFTFGGTDEERARDFQALLDDPKVKAIMCARGGYGFVRIIDKIDFTKLAAKPKWIIGFS